MLLYYGQFSYSIGDVTVYRLAANSDVWRWAPIMRHAVEWDFPGDHEANDNGK